MEKDFTVFFPVPVLAPALITAFSLGGTTIETGELKLEAVYEAVEY
jgi:hypothetical protein